MAQRNFRVPHGERVAFYAPPEVVREFETIAKYNLMTKSGLLRQLIIRILRGRNARL